MEECKCADGFISKPSFLTNRQWPSLATTYTRVYTRAHLLYCRCVPALSKHAPPFLIFTLIYSDLL